MELYRCQVRETMHVLPQPRKQKYAMQYFHSEACSEEKKKKKSAKRCLSTTEWAIMVKRANLESISRHANSRAVVCPSVGWLLFWHIQKVHIQSDNTKVASAPAAHRS